MNMHVGVSYSMMSTAIGYAENRSVAWQTRGPTAIGKYVGGWISRYELEPVNGGTEVRETWDTTHESTLTKPMVGGAGPATRKNMAKTVQMPDDLVTQGGTGG